MNEVQQIEPRKLEPKQIEYIDRVYGTAFFRKPGPMVERRKE